MLERHVEAQENIENYVPIETKELAVGLDE